jgi:hypothetical protein
MAAKGMPRPIMPKAKRKADTRVTVGEHTLLSLLRKLPCACSRHVPSRPGPAPALPCLALGYGGGGSRRHPHAAHSIHPRSFGAPEGSNSGKAETETGAGGGGGRRQADLGTLVCRGAHDADQRVQHRRPHR